MQSKIDWFVVGLFRRRLLQHTLTHTYSVCDQLRSTQSCINTWKRGKESKTWNVKRAIEMLANSARSSFNVLKINCTGNKYSEHRFENMPWKFLLSYGSFTFVHWQKCWSKINQFNSNGLSPCNISNASSKCGWNLVIDFVSIFQMSRFFSLSLEIDHKLYDERVCSDSRQQQENQMMEETITTTESNISNFVFLSFPSLCIFFSFRGF